MNVSALAQLTSALEVVLDDVDGLRRAEGRSATWNGMMCAVVDQLAQPAYFYLRGACAGEPVPTVRSAGYKIAAGFFDVLRRIQRRLARGEALEVDLQVFLELVAETGALLGASEVCAGPPNLIERAARAFIGEQQPPDQAPPAPRWRVDVAQALSAQLQLAVLFALFDGQLERRLFFDPRAPLAATNHFIRQQVEKRGSDIRDREPWHGTPRIEPSPHAERIRGFAEQLGRSMRGEVTLRRAEVDRLEAMLREPRGSLRLAAGRAREVAAAMATYLAAHEDLLTEQRELEQWIREAIGVPGGTPIQLHSLADPRCHTLRWFDAIVGRRPKEESALRGR